MMRFVAIMLCFLSGNCTMRQISRELYQVDQIKNINKQKTYLKVHLKNGELYVLNNWQFNEVTRSVSGYGNHLNANRKRIDSNQDRKLHVILFDDIIIVETNDKGQNPGVPALVIAGLITVPIAIQCLLNPKACFGSCPTFYIQRDTVSRLVAEGFSSSVSRWLETTDVDLIDFRFKEGDSLGITVKNEALETHMIRHINVLACDKSPGNRVLQAADGKFFEVSNLHAPRAATHGLNSILDEIENKDQQEWFSLSDSINLVRKEDIILEFPDSAIESGLVIDKRQSLMTTYLFYHSLSLTGKSAAHYYTRFERGPAWLKRRITKIYDLLGGIEVSVLNKNNQWTPVSTIRESGPIVSDVHLVRLPVTHTKTTRIRLRMSQGLWRINMANLCHVEREVLPVRLSPVALRAYGIKDNQKLQKLLNLNEYLVTYPGDVFRLTYPAVSRSDREYFIESTGYYIEWMREDWLKNEDIRAANRMLLFPRSYLKRMASRYKKMEPEMEEVFWSSRYVKNEN